MKHYAALFVTSFIFIICGTLDQSSDNPGDSIFIAGAFIALFGMIISFFYGLIQQNDDHERLKETKEEDG